MNGARAARWSQINAGALPIWKRRLRSAFRTADEPEEMATARTRLFETVAALSMPPPQVAQMEIELQSTALAAELSALQTPERYGAGHIGTAAQMAVGAWPPARGLSRACAARRDSHASNVAIVAHFDPADRIEPTVIELLKCVEQVSIAILFVSTSALDASALSSIGQGRSHRTAQHRLRLLQLSRGARPHRAPGRRGTRCCSQHQHPRPRPGQTFADALQRSFTGARGRRCKPFHASSPSICSPICSCSAAERSTRLGFGISSRRSSRSATRWRSSSATRSASQPR